MGYSVTSKVNHKNNITNTSGYQTNPLLPRGIQKGLNLIPTARSNGIDSSECVCSDILDNSMDNVAISKSNGKGYSFVAHGYSCNSSDRE